MSPHPLPNPPKLRGRAWSLLGTARTCPRAVPSLEMRVPTIASTVYALLAILPLDLVALLVDCN
eukprot:3757471-Prymnesium_polylepis.1